MSETFLDPSVTNEQIFLEGFQAPFRNDRNRHGGGVAVYVKNHISASRLGIFNHSSLESIWLKIRNKSNILYFNCTYRPPSSSVDFWDELYECVCCVKDLNMLPIIIMGDLNSDYFNETSEIRRFCHVTNLHQLITEPTRVPSNTLIESWIPFVAITNQYLLVLILKLNIHNLLEGRYGSMTRVTMINLGLSFLRSVGQIFSKMKRHLNAKL